ncbi:hypothetical protein BDZ97DRAFT_1912000 [Flammula alnicola]|nr:hypothetical protein BDZ97DRAFT_1912000 [Flammula alnicola]
MSTSSRITTDLSSGLGIELFPADTVNGTVSTISRSPVSDTQSDHGFGIQSTISSGSGLSSISTRSTSILPDPDADTSSAEERSIHVVENPGLRAHPSNSTSLGSESFFPDLRHEDGLEVPLESISLATGADQYRDSVELKTILGNASSRLKSGAVLLPFPEQCSAGKEEGVALEQARSRSRVDVDIFLENDICVEGGNLQGHIKVRVWKCQKKNLPILISGGKIRVIGFESVDNEEKRFTFYQCSAPLSEVVCDLNSLYSSEPDEEGFANSTEGIHSFPFVFHLTPSSEHEVPKGRMETQSGLSVRYIAMVSVLRLFFISSVELLNNFCSSLRIKDSVSGKKSISHFYRDCSIWPRLNPSVVLAPTSRPLQVTVSEDLRMGSGGQIYLTASLHRLHWIAGQFCHVSIKVVNNSKKALKNLSLELLRSTTVFKPRHKPKTSHGERQDDTDPNAFLASMTTKQVAQSTLLMGERGIRRHASAKGWWSGVAPGESQMFSHHILIPPDALSIPRGKLLQVSYTIQVTISAGTLLPTDTGIHASLPLEIINFLSIDPPFPTSISAPAEANRSSSGSYDYVSDLESRTDAEDSEMETDIDNEDDDYSSEREEEGSGNISIHSDTDEVVRHAIASARTDVEDCESAPRFADLYYSSLQENLDRAAEQFFEKQGQETPMNEVYHAPGTHHDSRTITTENRRKSNNFAARVEEKYLERQTARADTILTEVDPQDRPLADKPDMDLSFACPTEAPGSSKPASDTPQAAPSSDWERQSSASSRLPTPITQENRASDADSPASAKNTQRVRTCDTNAKGDPASIQSQKMPIPPKDPTQQRNAISGVELPNACVQRPHWKTPTTPGRERLPQTDTLQSPDNHAPPCDRSPEKHISVPNGVHISSPSAPRAGSVRDKIRELEELAARASTDA